MPATAAAPHPHPQHNLRPLTRCEFATGFVVVICKIAMYTLLTLATFLASAVSLGLWKKMNQKVVLNASQTALHVISLPLMFFGILCPKTINHSLDRNG